MNRLVHVEQKEIIIDFEIGRESRTTLHIRNLMYTMPVAFKLQTTSPHKFCVRPPNGYILPLSELNLNIILKPQQELPPSFPFSTEKFVLKTALAHITNENSVLPQRVPNGWFSSPQTRVFIDAELKVVYIGASLLRHCVAREDEDAVREMLERHAGPSVADEDGRTALHIAASIGNFKLVGMLLECGAEINAMDMNGRTPIWEAVCRGEVNVVKELLKTGEHIDKNEALKKSCVAPIHIAATLMRTEILEQLIENGANLETEDQEGRTAVHFAIESESLENLKVLLRAGANTNARRGDGKTPLLIAAENGLLEVVHLLLESGAGAHIKPENSQADSELASERGHVAVIEALKAGKELLRAARQGDADAVATLLQHGASKRTWIKDSAGWTPLHVAAFKGHVQIVQRLLLEEGGRTALQAGDVEGHTPLHCGAGGGSIEVVELLLAMGADPLAASSRGATPADLANALGFNTIAKVIQHRAISHGDDDYYNLELTKAKPLLHPPHTRSISPGSNLTSTYMPSATPDTNRKETLLDSSERFSPSTKLHQNNRKQLLPSLLNHSGRAPEDTISYSSSNGQHLTFPWHRASITSEDVKLMQTPGSIILSDAENAAESKPLSLPPMSSNATAMPTPEVSNTAPLADVQHAANNHIFCHKSGLQSLSQVVQNPSVVQSQQSHPSIATPIKQPNMQNSNGNLQSSRQQYTTVRGEGLNKSPQTLQVHLKTEDLNADVDCLALENSVVALQPQYTREVIKSLTFPTPRCEAQPQFIYKDMEDVGLCKQRSIVFASPASQKMAHANAAEDVNDCTSGRSLVDSKPQVLMVEKSANTKGQGHNKPSSMQAQTLTEDPSVDIKSMPTDKFTVEQLSTHEGNSLNLNKQHIPSAFLCCKQAAISTVEDKRVRSFVGQAHLSILEGSPTMETSPSISSSLSDFIFPEVRKQSEHCIQLASTPSGPVTQSQEMKGNNGISSACKTEETKQLEDTTSLKPTCKASSSDQNGPTYTPPLRIKQMKKPASTPKLRASNETSVAVTAAAESVERTKPRSLIFRDIFEQGTL